MTGLSVNEVRQAVEALLFTGQLQREPSRAGSNFTRVTPADGWRLNGMTAALVLSLRLIFCADACRYGKRSYRCHHLSPHRRLPNG
jgi:hypothetical protein